MDKIIFVTGGARSGKSTFAEKLAKELWQYETNKKIAYIASGEYTDDEFNERIKQHQLRRSDEFQSYEIPIYINHKIEQIKKNHKIIIWECVATWLGNLYYKEYENKSKIIDENLECLLSPTKNNQETQLYYNIDSSKIDFEELYKSENILIIVSNETGMGIVPADKLSREYRDEIGNINKRIANNSDYVFFSLNGITLKIK